MCSHTITSSPHPLPNLSPPNTILRMSHPGRALWGLPGRSMAKGTISVPFSPLCCPGGNHILPCGAHRGCKAPWCWLGSASDLLCRRVYGCRRWWGEQPSVPRHIYRQEEEICCYQDCWDGWKGPLCLLGPQQPRDWDHRNLGAPASLCVREPLTPCGFSKLHGNCCWISAGKMLIKKPKQLHCCDHTRPSPEGARGWWSSPQGSQRPCGQSPVPRLPAVGLCSNNWNGLWSLPTGLIFHSCLPYCSPDGEKSNLLPLGNTILLQRKAPL